MNKKLLITAVLIISSLCAFSQSISPDISTQFCPNTNITFTVTLPKIQNNTSVNVASWTGTPTVISGAQNISSTQTNTTFTFVGRFRDVNIKQEFKVEYTPDGGSPTSHVFTFKYIKSLFYDNPIGATGSPCEPFRANQTSINAPLCQLSDIPISVTTAKWSTYGEGADFCWGSISTYEYLLPNGWSIGSSVSNGSSWIQGGTGVTVKSDGYTGGVIRVRPVNSCDASLVKNSTQAVININRPGPTFTLSPTSVQIECGIPKTQTYTVTVTGNTSCPVTYTWNLGDNNGWLYNGLPAPTTPFTAPASITLTSLATNNRYSNVTVTPNINGVAQSSMTSVTSFKTPNMGLIGGSNSICSGTSPTFSLYNAPPNVSYYWGTTTLLPNYGATVVSVNTPYSNSTTLTKINSGVINLTASVTDACSQTYHVTRSNILVGGYASTELLSGYTLAYPPCYTQGCSPSAVSSSISSSGPYGTTVYSGSAYTNCTNYLYLYNSGVSSGTWSLNAGSVASWSSSNGNNLQFYPNGGPGDYAQFRLTVNTSCGTAYYDVNFYPVQYNYSGYYRIAPNPVTTDLTVMVDEKMLPKSKISKSAEQEIRELLVIDHMGRIRHKQMAGKGTKLVRVNTSSLTAGYYVLRIFDGKTWQNLPFMKQ